MRNLTFVLICLSTLLISEQTFAQRKKSKTTTAPSISTTAYEGLQWRHIGPFRGGRSAAVTGVSGKANLYYMGTTGGGVWRTNDAGNSWENISDGYFGGSIGAVAVSEWDNNVIYVGGGEETVRGNVSSGSGMYKSTDAGTTWESIGLKNSRHVAHRAKTYRTIRKNDINKTLYQPVDYSNSSPVILTDFQRP